MATIYKYRCPFCGAIIEEEVERAPKMWMKSWCLADDKPVRLQLLLFEEDYAQDNLSVLL